MGRLTRDGTPESVSRDQILRRERGQENLFFPVQLTTSRIGNLTRLILTLAICDDHTYIRKQARSGHRVKNVVLGLKRIRLQIVDSTVDCCQETDARLGIYTCIVGYVFEIPVSLLFWSPT